MSTQAQLNLATLVLAMSSEARIAALRKMTHSAIAATFGAIRQHLRTEANKPRDEDDTQPSIDKRNADDEAERGAEAESEIMASYGLPVEMTPLQRAERMFHVFAWADDECRKEALSEYECPMTPEQMLGFMIEQQKMPSEYTLKAASAALGVSIDDLRTMRMKALGQERAALERDRPAILSTFKSFGEYGADRNLQEGDLDGEDAVTNLTPVQQHQMAIKILSGLKEGYERAANSALRRDDISELAVCPIIKAEIVKLVPTIAAFERTIRVDIDTEVSKGRRVACLADAYPRTFWTQMGFDPKTLKQLPSAAQ